ncbi:MAG: type ISP restriction/modification enzyme [Cytophagales bacterium]
MSNKAQVFHFDLQGKREDKYDFLNQNSLASIAWNTLEPNAPNYFLVKKDFEESGDYEKGFKVDEVFLINTSGVKTHDDGNLISFKKFQENNHQYFYRPFDIQNIEYDLKKVVRHRYSVMKHLLKENIAILFPRQAITEKYGFFLSKGLTDINYTGTAGQFGAGLVFPLYFYPETSGQLAIGDNSKERKPNLNEAIVAKIAEGLGAKFVAEKETIVKVSNFDNGSFAPIDILDYIYAVLHSPTYREKYKEFLKIDFPRVPYPKSYKVFNDLIALGSQLRQIHLLESPIVENYITQYPIDGDNVVVKPRFETYKVSENLIGLGRVYINETQYFDNVPEVAWNFYIGGYQPAQKWLKDRKDRKLEFDDILHYQKIIVALTETDRLMKEIDLVQID